MEVQSPRRSTGFFKCAENALGTYDSMSEYSMMGHRNNSVKVLLVFNFILKYHFSLKGADLLVMKRYG